MKLKKKRFEKLSMKTMEAKEYQNTKGIEKQGGKAQNVSCHSATRTKYLNDLNVDFRMPA